MEQIKTILIKHNDVTVELMKQIAELKSIRWNYPVENQLKWMNDNLKNEDYHLLIYIANQLVAYTNFVDIQVQINKQPIPFKGIGNVCTAESGKGWGNLLMKSINEVIITHNWNGVLLCKDNLVDYYEKYGWILVDKNNIFSKQLQSINTLTFNLDSKIVFFEYNNVLF
jgi:hypothetical protein